MTLAARKTMLTLTPLDTDADADGCPQPGTTPFFTPSTVLPWQALPPSGGLALPWEPAGRLGAPAGWGCGATPTGAPAEPGAAGTAQAAAAAAGAPAPGAAQPVAQERRQGCILHSTGTSVSCCTKM